MGGLWGLPVHASEVRVRSRTIGEAYTVRVPGDPGLLLTRRRLVQYVNLGVFDLLPPRRADELHRAREDGQLRIVSSLRFRHDFGTYLSEARGSATLVQENDGRQLDLLYGYLEGENLAGWVDLRAGRQFELSGLDWYAFDGAWLRVRTPAHFAIEAFGGSAVDGSDVFGFPTHELDGSSGEPYTEANELTVGGALSLVDVPWLDGRVAYRRSFSPAGLNRHLEEVDGSEGLESSVDQEIVSLRLNGNFLKRRLSPWVAARMNLGTVRLDDLDVGVRWAFSDIHSVRARYLRTIPNFDLDSIWNLFAEPFEDVRAAYTVRPGYGWTFTARSQTRIFFASDSETFDVDPAERVAVGTGGGAAAALQKSRFSLRLDAWGLGGEGGVRAGASSDTRIRVYRDRLSLDGRMYWMHYEDQFDANREGDGYAVQAGLHARLYRGVHLDVLGEESFTPYTRHALRAMAILSADWTFGAGRR